MHPLVAAIGFVICLVLFFMGAYLYRYSEKEFDKALKEVFAAPSPEQSRALMVQAARNDTRRILLSVIFMGVACIGMLLLGYALFNLR